MRNTIETISNNISKRYKSWRYSAIVKSGHAWDVRIQSQVNIKVRHYGMGLAPATDDSKILLLIIRLHILFSGFLGSNTVDMNLKFPM